MTDSQEEDTTLLHRSGIALPGGGSGPARAHYLLIVDGEGKGRRIPLEKASRYIQSLLPAPLAEGPIRSDWVLVPCARLGGDAFGYKFLDERFFAIYLIDVSGHGTGAAMHAVSIINVLRQGALRDTDL